VDFAFTEFDRDMLESGFRRSNEILARNLDVRVVRGVRREVAGTAKTYRIEPFFLEKRKAFSLWPSPVSSSCSAAAVMKA